MAAPTDVRVEANSLSTTTLYWTYAGSAAVSVYRSTDGSAYTRITTVAASILTYNNTGLAAGTKYWYKLSDDDGSTFSSVVTVWTHGCVQVPDGGDGFSLPRFGDGSQPMPQTVDENGISMAFEQMEEQKAKLDDMAQRIEDTLQGRILDPAECAVCPEDGAIIISCSDGCRDFVVIADEDINSISIQMCDEGEGNIEFIVPPNVTRQICGWPSGFGFSGDECFRAPIITGSAGRSISVPFARSARAGGGAAGPPKSRPGYGKGILRGGMGGAGCTCVPGKNGQLTIKSCNPNNSLNCSSTKKLDLVACGGKPPYTWSKTGTIVLSRSTGERIAVTPPTNSGSGVSGDAYSRYGKFKSGSAGVCGTSYIRAVYGCNDQELSCATQACNPTEEPSCVSACTSLECVTCTFEGALDCAGSSQCETPCTGAATGCKICQGNCSAVARGGFACDLRTAPMIAAGCAPCGVAAASATVTVTDAVGVQTTIIVRA